MASVNISAWDIAQHLGLVYVGEKYGTYKFEFHGKVIECEDGWAEDHSKDLMAEKILMKLGQSLVEGVE